MKALLLGCWDTLGELVMSEPRLRDLRVKNPGIEIGANLNKDLGDLALASGMADKVIDVLPFSADIVLYASGPALSYPAPAISLPKISGAEGCVAIHANNQPGKTWPMASWEQLTKWITGGGSKVLLIGGLKDLDYAPSISRKLKSGTFELCFHQPLTRVAGLLQNCACLIGGETGISHLAAALGIKVLATWNPQYATYQPARPTFKPISLTASLEEMIAAYKSL